MTVYAVVFNASNRASYEDFWQMDYFGGCFSSLEKAKEWIAKDIPKIIDGKEDKYNVYEIKTYRNSWVIDVMLKPLPEGVRDYYWECDYKYTIEEITIDIPVIVEAEDRKGYN